ncbi:MAG: energy transducer TonB [Gammaproteobacteria bacterium]
MASRRIFTDGQWAAASGVALALHALLAWSLLSSVPVQLNAPAGQDGGLVVEGLALSGADLPLLQDAAADAALVMVTPATPIDAISRPVAPPEARPMTEALPIKPKRPPVEKPMPKSKPKQQRAPQAERSHPFRKPVADDTGKRSPKGERANAGSVSKDGTAGSHHAAAPVLGNPRPSYPQMARRRGQEGRVLIRVSVLGNGRVGSARVAKSSGYGSLDRAALKAVKRWRFEPALRAGKPVPATFTVPVTFRLEG